MNKVIKNIAQRWLEAAENEKCQQILEFLHSNYWAKSLQELSKITNTHPEILRRLIKGTKHRYSKLPLLLYWTPIKGTKGSAQSYRLSPLGCIIYHIFKKYNYDTQNKELRGMLADIYVAVRPKNNTKHSVANAIKQVYIANPHWYRFIKQEVLKCPHCRHIIFSNSNHHRHRHSITTNSRLVRDKNKKNQERKKDIDKIIVPQGAEKGELAREEEKFGRIAEKLPTREEMWDLVEKDYEKWKEVREEVREKFVREVKEEIRRTLMGLEGLVLDFQSRNDGNEVLDPNGFYTYKAQALLAKLFYLGYKGSVVLKGGMPYDILNYHPTKKELAELYGTAYLILTERNRDIRRQYIQRYCKLIARYFDYMFSPKRHELGVNIEKEDFLSIKTFMKAIPNIR